MVDKELIEIWRDSLKPSISLWLLNTNYEEMGEQDKEEFERDFDEILDLALIGLKHKAQLSQEGTTKDATSDTISRQAAIDAVDSIGHIATMPDGDKCVRRSAVKYTLSMLPSAQPELSHTQKSCEYCHEDSDGYTRPIEKNCHAYIRFGMNGWELDLKAKGWHGEAQIKFCPMCGRELQGGR